MVVFECNGDTLADFGVCFNILAGGANTAEALNFECKVYLSVFSGKAAMRAVQNVSQVEFLLFGALIVEPSGRI